MEAEKNSIYFKEEDPAAVALLIAWLYLDIIPGTENLATPSSASLFSFPRTIQIPTSKEGTGYQFVPTTLAVPGNSFLISNQLDSFQHICVQPQYTCFSPEELRLTDYQLGRKCQNHGPVLPTVTAPPPPVPITSATAVALPSSQRTGHGTFLANTGNGSSLLAQIASQTTIPHNTHSSLFRSGSHFATSDPQPSAPRATTYSWLGDALPYRPSPSQPSTLNATGSSITGTSIFAARALTPSAPQDTAPSHITQAASQPATSQTTSSFTRPGGQSSTSAFDGSCVQLGASAQQSIFATRGGPVAQSHNNNRPGTAPKSQAQSSVTGPRPQHALLPSQTHGLFGDMNSVISGPSSLPASATQISNNGADLGTVTASSCSPVGQPTSTSSQAFLPSTSLTSSASETSPLVATSSFGETSLMATGGGLFGSVRALPSADPNLPQGFSNTIESQITNSNVAHSLSPEAVMTTIIHHKPKVGEFGYHPVIKLEKSPNVFIPGIPRHDSHADPFMTLEKLQLALLNLCIMAETFCWPKLFNVAIDAYIRGEHRLQRPMSLDFIDRIYARTHDNSTLRAYALDSLCQMKTEGIEDMTPYIEMAHKHSDFLCDLLDIVLGSSTPVDVIDDSIQKYLLGQSGKAEGL